MKIIKLLKSLFTKQDIDDGLPELEQILKCKYAETINSVKIKQDESFDYYPYKQEDRGDYATTLLLKALSDKSKGEIDKSIELINTDNKLESFNMKAFFIDMETFNSLEEYGKVAKQYGNSEGYEFKFLIDPNFINITIPNCDCGNYEISDNFSIENNHMDSNCDTWGTSYSIKAEALYLFLILELNKFAIVQVKYWCL